jgi:hypothetical protein
MRHIGSFGAVAGLLGCACTVALGQSATNSEARSHVASILESPLSQPPPSGSMDLTVAVRDILSTAGTYGGAAVLDRCADHHRIAYRNTAHATTLKDALDAVVVAAPSYRWTLSDEGAIDLLPVGKLPPLLETEIHHFDWDLNRPMVTALADLSATHEVRQRKLELNLIQWGHGGLSAVPIGGPVEKPRDWRHVEHVSLLSALNAIARSYGNGVWVYSECRHADNVAIQLTSVVQ